MLPAVPKQLCAVPKLSREVQRWVGVVPKVLLSSTQIAADSTHSFKCHAQIV